MATMTKRLELENIVWTWERRDQRRRLMLWLPRTLAVGIIGFGMVWLLLRLIAAPLPLTVGGSLGAGLLLMIGLLIYRLRARPLMQAVQHFDQTLGLQERTSTALELLNGRIQTVDEIAHYQLEDAYRAAQRVDIRQAVPLVTRWRDWVLLIPLVLACALMVWGTQPPPVDALSPSTRDAITNAADEVRDITESVANDTSLSAGERQTLLDTLETSLDTLKAEPLSAEQAFASLSQVEDALQKQSQALQSTTQSENATYEAAANALNQKSGNQSSDSGIGEFQKAVEQMQQDTASNTPNSDTQLMQQSLDQAAQMMQDANPQMAQAMKDAAQAMKNGDQAAAQKALDQAQQEAQKAQNTQDQREATAKSLEDAAQNAGNASQNVAQSEQSSASPQSSDSNQQQGQQGQSQQGQSQNRSQSQQGQQQGQSQDQQGQQSQSQQGNGSQQGDPGPSDQGNNPSGPSRPGENGQSGAGDTPPSDSGSEQGAPNGQSSNSPSGTGGGAGDQSGPPQNAVTSGGQFSQDNNPDGTGETTYEPVFAPQQVNAKGTNDVILNPEASNQSLETGDFQANPNGDSRVPYNQVFSQYNEAANQAIEGGYIPLGLRDMVQTYFTSIAPQK